MSDLLPGIDGDFSKCITLPYDIFGVKLWSVEHDRYIHKYCDTKEDAEKYISDSKEKMEVAK